MNIERGEKNKALAGNPQSEHVWPQNAQHLCGTNVSQKPGNTYISHV